MIKFIFFFVFLLQFHGCSTAGLKRSPDKKIPVESATEARQVINNKLNFLKSLFTQSRDPYYNLPKWSEDCLRQNVIGEMNESKGIIFAVSQLWLNDLGQPGFCMGEPKTKLFTQVFVYCPDSNFVSEYQIPTSGEITIKRFCPEMEN